MIRKIGGNVFSYDPACEDLAASFLQDYLASTDLDRQELALAIQMAIEDYLIKFDYPGGNVIPPAAQ